MKIEIKSDGTIDGTILKVDGAVIENIVEMCFNCYQYGNKPGFSYTTEELYDAENGLVERSTYFLADQYKVDQMMKDKMMEDEEMDHEDAAVREVEVNGSTYKMLSVSKVIDVCKCDLIVAGMTHNSKLAKSEPAWSSVDKTKLPMVAFADHGDGKNHSSFKYPHHWISGGNLYLHRGGLAAARAAAQGARSGKKAKPSIVAHLAKHAKDIGMGDNEK
jgi:hypothetical protein